MSEKMIQISFSEEEVAKLQSSADAHKMELEAFVKAVVKESMKRTSHSS